MKQRFAKLGMPGILALVFLFGGLLFSATTVSAQQSSMSSGQPPSPLKSSTGWKTTPDAIAALKVQIEGFTEFLNTNTPGNALQIKMKILIFEGIVTSLESGMDVPNAAFTNYYKYAPASFKDYVQIFGMSNNDWKELYDDMLVEISL